MRIGLIFLIVVILFMPFQAQAYIGPGIGLMLIGGVWGFVLSVVFSIAMIFWRPLFSFYKKIKNRFSKDDSQAEPEEKE